MAVSDGLGRAALAVEGLGVNDWLSLLPGDVFGGFGEGDLRPNVIASLVSAESFP